MAWDVTGCNSRFLHLSLSHHPFPSSVTTFKLPERKSLGLYPPWLHVGFAKSFHIPKLLESLFLILFYFLFSPPLFTLCSPLLSLVAHLSQGGNSALSFPFLGNAKYCVKNYQKLQAKLLGLCRLTVMGLGFVCWGQAVPHSDLSGLSGVTGPG